MGWGVFSWAIIELNTKFLPSTIYDTWINKLSLVGGGYKTKYGIFIVDLGLGFGRYWQ